MFWEFNCLFFMNCRSRGQIGLAQVSDYETFGKPWRQAPRAVIELCSIVSPAYWIFSNDMCDVLMVLLYSKGHVLYSIFYLARMQSQTFVNDKTTFRSAITNQQISTLPSHLVHVNVSLKYQSHIVITFWLFTLNNRIYLHVFRLVATRLITVLRSLLTVIWLLDNVGKVSLGEFKFNSGKERRILITPCLIALSRKALGGMEFASLMIIGFVMSLYYCH